MAENYVLTPGIDNVYESATPEEAAEVASRFLDGSDDDFWPQVAVVTYDSTEEIDLLRVGKDGCLNVDMRNVMTFLFIRLTRSMENGDMVVISPCTTAVIVGFVRRICHSESGIIDILNGIVMNWNQELHSIGIDTSYRFVWEFVKVEEGLMPPVIIKLERIT